MSEQPRKRTIALYGRTNSGKTAQIGILAEYVYAKYGKKTRLASADLGGVDTVEPQILEGFIEPILQETSDPWIFLNKVTHGYIRDGKGKWVLDAQRNKEIGVWAFEGFDSFAGALKADLDKRAAGGANFGGTNETFLTSGEGEQLKIFTGNWTHYRIVQDRIKEEVWESQKLPGSHILWTSGVSKDDDLIAVGKVVGPDVIGKVLTASVPRWFNYTLRIDVLAVPGGKPERHLLYLGTHTDINTGNTAGLGNTRVPLDAPPLEKLIIEPANIVEALQMLTETKVNEAREVIRKRLATARRPTVAEQKGG